MPIIRYFERHYGLMVHAETPRYHIEEFLRITNKFEPFDEPCVDIPELLELLQTRGITLTNSKPATEILKNYGSSV